MASARWTPVTSWPASAALAAATAESTPPDMAASTRSRFIAHQGIRPAPHTGAATPPTQWITRRMVTLRVGLFGGLSAGLGPVPDRDAVADGDLLGADKDVFDEQPEHALAFFGGGGGGIAAELCEEAFEVVGELEVGVAVGELGVQGIDLGAQAGFAGAQVR